MLKIDFPDVFIATRYPDTTLVFISSKLAFFALCIVYEEKVLKT